MSQTAFWLCVIERIYMTNIEQLNIDPAVVDMQKLQSRYPGSELIHAIETDNGLVGIININNEDRLVRLPILDAESSLDTKEHKETPYRDVMYRILGLQEGDSARQQLLLDASQTWYKAKTIIPENGRIIQNLAKDLSEKAVDVYSRLDRVGRRITIAGVIASTGAVAVLGANAGQTEQIASETNPNQVIILKPEPIKFDYQVPKSSPKITDLAKATGTPVTEITKQVKEQIGENLTAESALPAGVVLSLEIKGTKYSPTPNETFEYIASRYEVPVGVLLAANPDLKGIGNDGIVADVVDTVTIPKPIEIEVFPNGQDVSSTIPEKIADDQTTTIAETTSSIDTSTTSVEVTTTTLPEKPAIAPEVARVNELLDRITLDSESIDLNELRDAVNLMYQVYRPNDKDRLPETPEYAIKAMLPHEALGINVPFSVAERTADVERYASAETYSAFLATAKLLRLLIAKSYPQYSDCMLTMRDMDAPVHHGHNNSNEFDFGSNCSWKIQQYSDGPVADFQFSPNFNKELTIELATYMGKLTMDKQPLIKRIISSGQTMAPEVNRRAGRVLMKNASYHKDHFHINLADIFAKPIWRPRLKNLPWSEDQDLRIGNQAVEISPEQHASQHADLEEYIRQQLTGAVNNSANTTTTVVAPEQTTTSEPAKSPLDSLPESSREYIANQIKKAEVNKDVYLEIERQTGVPWQIMAAIHFREGGNDPNKSMMAGEAIGSVNPDQKRVVGKTLLENGIHAATHLKNMARDVYGIEVKPGMPTDELAKAILAYHRGRMYKRAGQDPYRSPYISNGMPGHENMTFPWSGEPARTKGRKDARPGALSMLVGLGYIEI